MSVKPVVEKKLFKIVTQKKIYDVAVSNKVFHIESNGKLFVVRPQQRIMEISPKQYNIVVSAKKKYELYAQSTKGDTGAQGIQGIQGEKGDDGGLDYANMTLDTSPEDADIVPVNGTRDSVLSQLKISLANIKSYVLGTLFNASSGHDHDGTDSKQISASNISGLFSAIYPIGSIYMSVNSTNPSSLFGGTWTAWGAGRVPVGFDSSQSEFDTVEETGGEKTHTLTVAEMPSHTHSFARPSWYIADFVSGYEIYTPNGYKTSMAVTMNTNATGDGGSHNNLQPYIVCYMWKRVS